MIRKYKEDEIPILVEIWEEASAKAHPFLDSEFTEMVKNAMNNVYLPNSDTWVYEESGKIIGFISMLKNEIGGLFIYPDYHKKGIGTKLLTHIHQFHDELEVEVFENNQIGKPFYDKNGFEVFKDYIMEGTDQKVLRMRKQKNL